MLVRLPTYRVLEDMAPKPLPDVAELMLRLADGWYWRPRDPVKAAEHLRRSARPEVGDLVVIMMTEAPAAIRIGRLESIEPPVPSPGEDDGVPFDARAYTLTTLSGQAVRWCGVSCFALPVGNPMPVEAPRAAFTAWEG